MFFGLMFVIRWNYANFAQNISQTMEINYENSDIETLITKGQGSFLARLHRRRTFLKVLKSFIAVLEVISETKDLLYYKWLNHNAGKDVSFVLLTYSKYSCKLLFSEQEAGKKITIKDLQT